MLRRNFIKIAGTSVISAQSIARRSLGTDVRPNILLIMTDQQFAGAMSCAGDASLQTPNMDWLATRGILFNKAYCSNPICVPSRSSMITGRLPHEIDVNYNIDNKYIHASSVGRLLKNAGYDTGYVGKWHIPMANSNAQWHGFNTIQHALNNGIDPLIAKPSVDFIRRKRDKPFFLISSFVNPHDICEWARIASGIEDTLPNGEIPPTPPPEECPPLPKNFAIPNDEPSVIRDLQRSALRTYPVRNWSPNTWRQYRWAYSRMIEKVDAQIGEILRGLKESGELDKTLIVFTSDHGDGMGAHQWNQKTLFYDESSRVPFIAVRPYNKESSVNNTALINTGTDLAATFMDYAKQPLDDSYHGKSIKSILENRTKKSHQFVVSENNLAPKYGQPGKVYGRMVRTQRYKYVIYSTGTNREQLHDMELDSGEMHNLIQYPDYQNILKDHQNHLSEWIRQTKDFFPEPLTLGP